MKQQEFQSLVEFLEETPKVIQRLTDGLSREQLTQRPSEGEFSVLEHVWHLRDIEHEGYAVRIEKLLTEDNPALQDIAGARLAAERGYHDLDFSKGLAEFSRGRKDNIGVVKNLSDAQLKRRGRFEAGHEVTLEKVLVML